MFDKLEPGRELDTAIAKYIMQWHIAYWRDETDGGSQWEDAANKYQAAHSVDKDPHWRWSPSTDIKAAWRVIEKMLSMGYEVSIANRKEDDNEDWGVDFYKMKDAACFDECISANASTVSLAICKAALKAIL